MQQISKTTNKQTLIDTDNTMVVTGGNGYWEGWLVKGRGSKDIVTEDWTWGGAHTMQFTHDMPLNCTLETYII